MVKIGREWRWLVRQEWSWKVSEANKESLKGDSHSWKIHKSKTSYHQSNTRSDRYTVDTIYREGLAAAVAADTETWIQNAKEAEASGEQPSELEILTKTVTKQQAQIESINQSVDDITLAILGGE